MPAFYALIRIFDFCTKWHQCQTSKFEMLQSKRNTNNRQATANAHGNGTDTQAQTA